MTVPFIFIFSAGMVAAFNPCGIVMLPSYISYLIGEGEVETRRSLIRTISKGLWLGLSMTLGFLTIFVIAGFLLSLLGRALINVFPIWSFLMGVLIFLLGLGMLLGKKVSLPLRVNIKQGKRSVYFYGIAYGITSLSCTLPAFLFVLTESMQDNSLLMVILKFIVYSIGMGVVVTSITIVSLVSKRYVQQLLSKNMAMIQFISSIVILISGIYISYYWGIGPGGIFR